MGKANKRIAVLATAHEKRRSAASCRVLEDDEILEGMIGQVRKATAQASAAIEDALAFVAASDKRIAALEARRRER